MKQRRYKAIDLSFYYCPSNSYPRNVSNNFFLPSHYHDCIPCSPTPTPATATYPSLGTGLATITSTSSTATFAYSSLSSPITTHRRHLRYFHDQHHHQSPCVLSFHYQHHNHHLNALLPFLILRTPIKTTILYSPISFNCLNKLHLFIWLFPPLIKPSSTQQLFTTVISIA